MPTELEKWEARLEQALARVDDYLERHYGHLYPLHPRRPKHGSTARPAHDGLFRVGAAFSLGIGSEHGRGYVVDVRISTLSDVPMDVRKEIMSVAADRIRAELQSEFPERELHVVEDGPVYRISGDLSLR